MFVLAAILQLSVAVSPVVHIDDNHGCIDRARLLEGLQSSPWQKFAPAVRVRINVTAPDPKRRSLRILLEPVRADVTAHYEREIELTAADCEVVDQLICRIVERQLRQMPQWAQGPAVDMGQLQTGSAQVTAGRRLTQVVANDPLQLQLTGGMGVASGWFPQSALYCVFGQVNLGQAYPWWWIRWRTSYLRPLPLGPGVVQQVAGSVSTGALLQVRWPLLALQAQLGPYAGVRLAQGLGYDQNSLRVVPDAGLETRLLVYVGPVHTGVEVRVPVLVPRYFVQGMATRADGSAFYTAVVAGFSLDGVFPQ